MNTVMTIVYFVIANLSECRTMLSYQWNREESMLVCFCSKDCVVIVLL